MGAQSVSKRTAGRGAKRSAPNHAPDRKPAKKHQGDTKLKKGKRRAYDTAEIVQGHVRDVEDDDLEAFDEYKDFHSFLSSIDPDALAQRVKKQKRASIPDIAYVTRASALAARGRSIVDLVAESTGIESEQSELEIATRNSVADFNATVSVSESNDDVPVHQELDHVTNSTDDNFEADYEAVGRVFKNQPRTSDRLPIKSRDGRVHLPVLDVKIQSSVDASGLSSDVKPYINSSETDVEQLEEAEFELTPAQLLAETKERLAKIASAIIEDPEENIDSLTKLREVLSHASSREQQFALLTLTAVYKDIIPGYRIRPLTDVEKAEKVTKEIKKTRNFEQTLVNGYQQFVSSLMSFCKVNRREASSGKVHPLKHVAVTAACSLLSSAPHFNFRTELFSIIVNQVCRKTKDHLFNKSLSTLTELFANDEEGDASFEAVRLLTKKMKDREYQVDESTISSFLHLRLLSELEARASTSSVDRKVKGERKFINKRNKKLIKAQKEVEKDLREAEATVDVQSRERLQSDTLKLVFATYFRILQTGNRLVMGAALEGLARFAHLINVDFFGDLLEVLKQLLADVTEISERTLTTRASLLCIVTAFALQTGQSGTKETMTLDLSQFLQGLYSTIIDLSFNADIETAMYGPAEIDNEKRATINVATEAEMLLRALDAVFFKQRAQTTQTRLAAFVKRLSLCAVQFPEKSAAGSLELIKRLSTRYSRLVSLYTTDDTAADGSYDGMTNSLELTNAATTNAYELALFQKHYSPKVRQAVSLLLENLRESASKSRH